MAILIDVARSDAARRCVRAAVQDTWRDRLLRDLAEDLFPGNAFVFGVTVVDVPLQTRDDTMSMDDYMFFGTVENAELQELRANVSELLTEGVRLAFRKESTRAEPTGMVVTYLDDTCNVAVVVASAGFDRLGATTYAELMGASIKHALIVLFRATQARDDADMVDAD